MQYENAAVLFKWTWHSLDDELKTCVMSEMDEK